MWSLGSKERGGTVGGEGARIWGMEGGWPKNIGFGVGGS